MNIKLYDEVSEEILIIGCFVENLLDKYDIIPNIFNDPRHQRIISNLLKLKSKNIMISDKSFDSLENSNYPEFITDREHLRNIFENSTFAIDYNHAFKLVTEFHKKRLFHEQIGQIYNSFDSLNSDEIQDKLLSLNLEMSKQTSQIKDYSVQLQNAYDYIFHEEREYVGIPTGISTIDKCVSIEKGNTFVIGAGTGLGKSTLAHALGIEFSKQGNKGLLFALEMSENDMMLKTISNLSGVEYSRLKAHNTMNNNIKLSPNEVQQVNLAFEKAKKVVLNVSSNFSISINDLVNQTRTEYLKGNVDYLIVDQIALISNEAKDERMRLKKNSWELRKLAKELDIPIIILTQLNREAENAAPGLHHIAESSSIAHDTSGVMILTRKREDTNEAQINVVKNRYGYLGAINLEIDFAKSRIKET